MRFLLCLIAFVVIAACGRQEAAGQSTTSSPVTPAESSIGTDATANTELHETTSPATTSATSALPSSTTATLFSTPTPTNTTTTTTVAPSNTTIPVATTATTVSSSTLTSTTATRTTATTQQPSPSPSLPNITSALYYVVLCTQDGITCVVRSNQTSPAETTTHTEQTTSSRLPQTTQSPTHTTGPNVSASRVPRNEQPRTSSEDQLVELAALSIENTLNETGWDMLNITFVSSEDSISNSGAESFSTGVKRQNTNGTRSFEAEPTVALNTYYYAAGYLEGFVTFQRIFNSYSNVYRARIESLLTSDLTAWLNRNSDWMYRYTTSASNSNFASKLSNLIVQLKGMANGLADGCAAATNSTYDPCPTTVSGPLLATNPELAILAMHMYHELPDLYAAYTVTSNGTAADPVLGSIRDAEVAGSGSAIVKATATDILVGHATIAPYQSMLRQFKTYTFEGTSTISMSSYPGLISSQDEWYTTKNGLAVAQTRLPVFDNSIFVSTLKNQFAGMVPSFYRCMVANYLATSVADWQSYFGMFPSGTGNGQWLIGDMNVFDGAHRDPRASGGFLVLETMPGLTVSTDLTASLVTYSDKNGYGFFASYNLAYAPGIAAISGQSAMAARNGTYFAFGESPRAKLFSAFQQKAEDVPSLGALLRMNKFDINLPVPTPSATSTAAAGTTEQPTSETLPTSTAKTTTPGEKTTSLSSTVPSTSSPSTTTAPKNDTSLSARSFPSVDYDQYSTIPNCAGAANNNTCDPSVSAMLAVAARGDLNPAAGGVQGYGYLNPFVGQMNLGAIDAKVTSRSWSMQSSARTYIVSGPSSDDQPIFSFSGAVAADSCREVFLGVRHDGLPDVFNFTFQVAGSVSPTEPVPPSDSSSARTPVGGIAGSVVGCVFGVLIIVLVSCTKRHGTPTKGYRPLTGSKEQLLWLQQQKEVTRQERSVAAEERRRAGQALSGLQPAIELTAPGSQEGVVNYDYSRRQSKEVIVPQLANTKPGGTSGSVSRQPSWGNSAFGGRQPVSNNTSSDNITAVKGRTTSVGDDTGPLSHAPAYQANSISSPVEMGGATTIASATRTPSTSLPSSVQAKPKRSYKDYMSGEGTGSHGSHTQQ